MMLLIYAAIVLGVIAFIKYSLWREKYSQQFPGIKPAFFNVLGDLSGLLTYLVSNDDLPMLYHLLLYLKARTERFQRQQLFCAWEFYKPYICFVKAEAVKQLLSKGTGATGKNWVYDYLKPFLGSGLVTSSVEKWKPRRKLLAPCFHADILRGFLTVFNECSHKLVEHFQQETKKEFTYIRTPVTLTALDILNEAVLGATVGALENNSLQYIDALNRLLDIYTSRMFKFWEWTDFIFSLTSGREAKRHLKAIQDFTTSINLP
ncbi:cytochrome P450 4V2 [Trichonephila clavata]|uniref:Cytochrome P450 4V2 n=1 Tax=Trichonephila clavata TaxID=2740835 RepID=A0A8X6H5E6_TRICU|nr:cytochrome P450 4V2 [Trichonephila clavata]